MNRTLATRPEAAEGVALRPGHVDAIAAAANASHSASTRRNYRSACARFADWPGREGYPALPAAPEHVAAYLAGRARSAGTAAVRMDRAAIGFAHREAGAADPTATAGVGRVLRGIARTRRSAPRQAAALTAEAMAAIRATAHLPRTGPTGRTESKEAARRRAVVDIALAATVRDALLRRSEAAALRWADIEFRPDGSGRVTVRTSKTDQEGAGAVQYVGKAASTALRALRRLQGPDVSENGRVFGLRSGRSVSNRLAATGRAAGIDGLTGHSRTGRHGKGPSGLRGQRFRRPGRRPLAVRQNASPLRPRRIGRTGGRRSLLQTVRGALATTC